MYNFFIYFGNLQTYWSSGVDMHAFANNTINWLLKLQDMLSLRLVIVFTAMQFAKICISHHVCVMNLSVLLVDFLLRRAKLKR